MKDSGKFDPKEEPATEVELSAQELFELAPSPAIEQPGRCVDPEHTGKVAPAIAPPAQTRNMSSLANRRMPASRVVLAFSVVIAAVTVISAQYIDSTPQRPMQLSMGTSPHEAPPVDEPELPADIDGPPVLFTNPFDNSEVFEFPPGTSEAEVRAGVADLLIKRATERRGQIDARPIK